MGLIPRPEGLTGEEYNSAPVPDALHGLVHNHVASFDYFVERGLSEVVERLQSVAFQAPGTTDDAARIKIWFEDVRIGKPSREGDASVRAQDPMVFPKCRRHHHVHVANDSHSVLV